MHPIRCLLLVPLLLAAGCDELESNEPQPQPNSMSVVRAEFEVDTRPDSDGNLATLVSAILFDSSRGQPAPIVLEDGNTLKATAAGQTKLLEQLETEEGGPSGIYEADFQPDIAGQTLTMTLDVSTPGSWFPRDGFSEPDFNGLSLELMEDFTIDSPSEDEEFALNDDTEVTVTWTPHNVADDRRLLFQTTCPPGADADEDASDITRIGEMDVDGDPGIVTIGLTDMLASQPDPEAGECDIQLVVIGEVRSSQDPGPTDSIIVATHRRWVFIRSIPPGS